MIKKNIKNILTLSSGTITGQILGLISIPILGGMYFPAQFGEFANFTGLALLLGLFTTLKYEKSIILPSCKKEALSVLGLNIFLVFIFLMLLFVFCLGQWLLDVEVIGTEYIVFLFLAITATSLLSVQRQWLQRNEQYVKMAQIATVQSIITLLIPIIVFYLKLGINGLIIGYALGTFLPLVGFGIGTVRSLKQEYPDLKIEDLNLLETAKSYIKFPTFYLPYTLFSTGLLYLTPLLLTQFFDKESVGLYNMSYKILMVPHVVISFGFVNVFLVEANKLVKKAENFSKFYSSTFFTLLGIGLVIYGLAYFIGSHVIIYLLGSKWNQIGEVLPIVCIWLFFEFISTVFRSNTYIITEKQHIGLIIQVIHFSLIVGGMYLFQDRPFLWVLKFYVAIMSIFSLIHLIITYRLSCAVPTLVEEGK